MPLPVVRYPEDLTGTNPNNLVVREEHTLSAQPVRVIIPHHGPFFADSTLHVYDDSTNTELTRGVHFKVVEILTDLGFMAGGKEVAQVILITDAGVSSSTSVTYQSVGGNYQFSAQNIMTLLEAVLNDNREVLWENIRGLPFEYPPSMHAHLATDLYRLNALVVSLERIYQGITLSNLPQFEALISWCKTEISAIQSAIETHVIDAEAHPHLLESALISMAPASGKLIQNETTSFVLSTPNLAEGVGLHVRASILSTEIHAASLNVADSKVSFAFASSTLGDLTITVRRNSSTGPILAKYNGFEVVANTAAASILPKPIIAYHRSVEGSKLGQFGMFYTNTNYTPSAAGRIKSLIWEAATPGAGTFESRRKYVGLFPLQANHTGQEINIPILGHQNPRDSSFEYRVKAFTDKGFTSAWSDVYPVVTSVAYMSYVEDVVYFNTPNVQGPAGEQWTQTKARWGSFVAVNDNKVLVGAPGDDTDANSRSGYFLYAHKPKPDTYFAYEVESHFHESVDGVLARLGFTGALSADGTTIILGGPNYSDVEANEGIVNVLRQKNGRWEVFLNLEGGAAGMYLGTSVACSASGRVIAASDRFGFLHWGIIDSDFSTFEGSGNFNLNEDGSTATSGRVVGISVSDDGEFIAAVILPNALVTGGHLRIYRKSGSTFVHEFSTAVADASALLTTLGWEAPVSLCRDYLASPVSYYVAVGKTVADPSGVTNAGSVALYRRNSVGPTWDNLGDITAQTPVASENVGRRVVMRVYPPSYKKGTDPSSGMLAVYASSNGGVSHRRIRSWLVTVDEIAGTFTTQENTPITPSADDQTSDDWGKHFAVTPNLRHVYVGAPKHSQNAALDDESGAVYVYSC